MSTRINDLSPANQKIFQDMLTEVLRELEFDCYDMCVYASALGSSKALTPSDHEELKHAYVIARRMHGLARMQHRDD
jgi:hypothetical protein